VIELWIPITILAAFCQNLRSAVQKHLKGALSDTGATFSRFGYGFPVALAYALGLHYGAGMAWPEPGLEFILFGLIGGAAQIGATFLLVWLFSFRDFAVGTTYSKTETVQAALFGLVILGDGVGLAGCVAIFVSLIGVMLLSTAKSALGWRKLLLGWTERTALLGVLSGTLFGVSAVSFRAASLSLGDPAGGGGPGFLMQAAFTLAAVTFSQSVAMAVWMACREPGQLGAGFIRSELTAPRKPHDDGAGEDAEHDLGDDGGHPVADAEAALVLQHHAINHEADHPCEEHHEGVHHPLDQGQRHHVAIGHMADLVADDGFDLAFAHVLQQPGADCHQGFVAVGPGGEGVWLPGWENGHLRHADAGFFGQGGDRFEQPALRGVGGPFNDLCLRGPLGEPLRQQQRNEGPAKAEQGAEHQQRP